MQNMGNPPDPLHRALADLQSACTSNDRLAAYRATLALAEATWPGGEFGGAQGICQRLEDGDLKSAIGMLERAIYGPGDPSPDEAWSGDIYWRILGDGLERPDEQAVSGGLIAPLHPAT